MRWAFLRLMLPVLAWLPAALAADRPAVADPAASGAATDPGVERDSYNMVLLAPSRPVFLRLHIRLDGVGLKGTRAEYAATVLKQFDANRDGALSRDEARAMPPLLTGANAGEAVSVDDSWEAVDIAPPDDRVDAGELSAFIDRVFGNPLSIVARPQRSSQSVDLFSMLDESQDGKLDAAELSGAQHSLRKLDIDLDETFNIDELQPLRNPAAPGGPPAAQANSDQPFLPLFDAGSIAVAAKQIADRYGRSGRSRSGGLNAVALGLSAEQFAACDGSSDGRLDSSELTALLQNPPAQVELEARLFQRQKSRPQLAVLGDAAAAGVVPSRQGDRVGLDTAGIAVEFRATGSGAASTDNRKFYTLRFRVADRDKNGYLDPQEFREVGLADVEFKTIDRNGDEMIVADELMAWVEGESASSQARVVFLVTYDGKSLFEALDADLDRRLSRRELARAAELVRPFDRDRDGTVSSVELSGKFRVSIELGKPALFRPQATGRPDTTTPMVRTPGSGPEWFRKMDRNRDGDVSPKEFVGPPAAFRKLDADHDGLISAAEAERAAE